MFLPRIFISILIFLFICLPLIVAGWFIVPVLLLTSWSRKTGWWGNARNGDGSADAAYDSYFAKGGFLSAYNWLAWRNPINNFSSDTIAVKITGTPTVIGNPNANTNSQAGWYAVKMGWFWEYLIVIPYNIFGVKKCIYGRFGWKIAGNTGVAQFACTFNPWISYSGA